MAGLQTHADCSNPGSWTTCPPPAQPAAARPATPPAQPAARRATPHCRLFTLLQTGRMKLDTKGGWKHTEAVQVGPYLLRGRHRPGIGPQPRSRSTANAQLAKGVPNCQTCCGSGRPLETCRRALRLLHLHRSIPASSVPLHVSCCSVHAPWSRRLCGPPPPAWRRWSPSRVRRVPGAGGLAASDLLSASVQPSTGRQHCNVGRQLCMRAALGGICRL